MTSGMPELGSKISLISKADIRYEGRLFTVDPQECTIALSSVRSFGTEDRDTPFKIAPQSQIYDYILFRGSDIKDIRVVNNTVPHPNDPAIMQVQLPNGQHLMPHFPMGMGNPQAPPQQHGGPGTSGGNSGNQGAFGNPFGNMAGLGNLGGGGQQMGGSSGGGNNVGQSMAPGSGPTGGPFMMGGGNQQQQMQQQQQQQQQQQNKQMPQQQQKQPISVLDMLADASRSTTPTSLISRKSPAGDMNLQQQQQHHQQQQQQQMLHHNQHNQNQANAGHGGNSRDAGHKRQTHPQQQQQQQQQRGNRNGGNNGNGNGGNNTDYYHHQQQQLQRMNNYAQYHDGRNNYNNQRNQNQNRAWTMHRGGPNNMQNNMMMRNRGGGGGGGGGRGRMPNQGYRPIGGVGGLVNKPRNNKAIKFEQDFDFEQANNKFEELRSQLSKLKVGDEPNKAATPASATTATTEQLNGETDKKDDSGNETGAGEHEHEDEEISVGYDKTKSFFDNISCEAAQDRTKNNKTNWRQERKLNSETFGVTSTRRGSYRGRPNYYNNRNANNYMGGGGGYNRGYRGGNNYRNRSNNRMGGNGRGDGTNSNGNGGGSLTNVDIASAGAAASAVGGGTVSAPGTPTGGANVAANLKNQAQQPTNAAGSSDAPSATATPTTKAAILQENNSQPQAVAAGGQ